jgi:hypothetical protein
MEVPPAQRCHDEENSHDGEKSAHASGEKKGKAYQNAFRETGRLAQLLHDLLECLAAGPHDGGGQGG